MTVNFKNRFILLALSHGDSLTRPLRNERGVTLIEMLIYTVIAGMMLALAVVHFTSQSKAYNQQDVIAEIQQNVRGATNMMISDVRLAGLGLVESPDPAFAQADPYELAVNYWADPDDYWSHVDDYWGDLNDENMTVHYRLTGATLERAITPIDEDPNPSWQTLVENVDNLRFEYLLNLDPSDAEGDWQWIGNPDETDDDEMEQIRAVKILILGSARPAAFNRTDPTTYTPPIQNVDTPEPDWVPAPDSGAKRMISVIAQARNNRD